MLGIPDTDIESIRDELRSACSNEVNKLLFEYVGATRLNACSESDLLAHIKSVAVKVTHKAVHRVEFDKMFQNDGETITRYVSQLNAKAFLCEFEIQCSCTPQQVVSYAEERVSERLLAGLRNQEHQAKILNEAATLVTLDQKIKRLQILESTEDSANSLHQTPAAKAAAGRSTSTYKSQKKKSNIPTNETSSKCGWCGRTSHGADKTMERVHCPAREKECSFCHKKGHFAEACRGKALAQAAQAGVSENNNNNNNNNNNDNNNPLQEIPAEASVSFAFSAESSLSSNCADLSEGTQDFHRTRRPTVKR